MIFITQEDFTFDTPAAEIIGLYESSIQEKVLSLTGRITIRRNWANKIVEGCSLANVKKLGKCKSLTDARKAVTEVTVTRARGLQWQIIQLQSSSIRRRRKNTYIVWASDWSSCPPPPTSFWDWLCCAPIRSIILILNWPIFLLLGIKIGIPEALKLYFWHIVVSTSRLYQVLIIKA